MATSPLAEVAWVFGKLGTVGFGGPAAHVAMMEEEVVRRRKWVSREEFLDLVGACSLIPGPNSTELAIHLGKRRAGWAGLVTAGVCFIAPAMLIVGTLAWVYVRYGARPEVRAVMYGLGPVILAVVAQAVWGLGRTAVKSRFLGFLGGAAVAAALLGIHELAILAAAGVACAIVRRGPRGTAGAWMLLPAGASAAPAAFSLGSLFFVFLKIGAVLYGSGYVLVAFLRSDLVERLHWLTEGQLLDAIAVGQVTPGPVFTTATFIGYLLGGTSGALVATAAIFLPAFVFVAISGPLVPRLRSSPVASAVLDGVNVASLALMIAVAAQLARTAIVDVPTVLLAAGAAFVLVRWSVGSVWLVMIGAVVGLLRWWA